MVSGSAAIKSEKYEEATKHILESMHILDTYKMGNSDYYQYDLILLGDIEKIKKQLETTSNLSYLKKRTNYTISILSEKLPPEQFLQINRANIIHKQKIKEIEKHFNGKFQITMKDKAQTKLMSGGTFSDSVKELFF